MPAEDNFPGIGMLHPLEVPNSHTAGAEQDEHHYSLAPIKAQILQAVSETRNKEKKSGNENSPCFYLGWQKHHPAQPSSSSLMTV